MYNIYIYRKAWIVAWFGMSVATTNLFHDHYDHYPSHSASPPCGWGWSVFHHHLPIESCQFGWKHFLGPRFGSWDHRSFAWTKQEPSWPSAGKKKLVFSKCGLSLLYTFLYRLQRERLASTYNVSKNKLWIQNIGSLATVIFWSLKLDIEFVSFMTHHVLQWHLVSLTKNIHKSQRFLGLRR